MSHGYIQTTEIHPTNRTDSQTKTTRIEGTRIQ